MVSLAVHNKVSGFVDELPLGGPARLAEIAHLSSLVLEVATGPAQVAYMNIVHTYIRGLCIRDG